MGEFEPITSRIRPATDLRTQFSNVMEQISRFDDPVYLTKNGRCNAVIMNAVAFSKYCISSEIEVNEHYDDITVVIQKKKNIRCSFCGKPQHKANKLVEGPDSLYICDECIELCREIIRDDETPKEESKGDGENP